MNRLTGVSSEANVAFEFEGWQILGDFDWTILVDLIPFLGLILGLLTGGFVAYELFKYYRFNIDLNARFPAEQSTPTSSPSNIKWDRINPNKNKKENRFWIDNKDEVEVKIEVRFQVDEKWVPTKNALSSPEFSEVSVGSAIYTKNIILGPGAGTSFKFPFRPDTKEGTCLITILPSVDAYNIGLPTIFGEIDLQPIEHEYNIEVESEYLEQVLSDRFSEYKS